MDGAENSLATFSKRKEMFDLFKVDGAVEAAQAYLDLYTGNSKPTLEEGAPTKNEKQERSVCETILREMDFLKVTALRSNGVFYKEKNTPLYKRLTDDKTEDFIKEAFARLYRRRPSASKIKQFGETLMSWVDNKIERIRSDYIMIGNDLFWSVEDQKIITELPDGVTCMRRLFDTPKGKRGSDGIVNVEFDKDEESYEQTCMIPNWHLLRKHLEKNNGRINVKTLEDDCPMYGIDKQPLNAFWLWANEDEDMFNDLLMATSCNFMRVKPKGAFILIGDTRNGKSTFINLLHTQFGQNNTSEVTLAGLDDPHLNMKLMGSMLNAPDEEEEGKGGEVLRAQAKFKSLAMHKPIPLPVYYSQDPQLVPTDFMSYHPMNALPQWKGTGAEACFKRSMILMFDHDFSKEDNNGREFEKETYTEQFFSLLLPVEFAFAKYYDDKPFELSKKQKQRKANIESDVDNMTAYLNRFLSYFPGGYETTKLVYTDYKLWCDAQGYNYAKFGEFSNKLKLKGKNAGPSKLTLENGDRIPIVRLAKGKEVFHRKAKIAAFGGHTVEYIMTDDDGFNSKHPHKATSVIDELEVRLNAELKNELVEGNEDGE